MTLERDPVMCAGCDDQEAKVATPAGALCRTCADDFAAQFGWGR